MRKKKQLETINVSEASLIHSLQLHDGWKILQRELKAIHKELYLKLRKSKRDSEFYKIQGSLDIIDRINNLVEQKVFEPEEEGE